MQCKTCYSGKNYAGGADLKNGTCINYCNQQRICGTTTTYKTGGVDCTKCTSTAPATGTNANTFWPSIGIAGGLTAEVGTNIGGECSTSLYGCCPGAVGAAKTTIACADANCTNCAMVVDNSAGAAAGAASDGFTTQDTGKAHKCTIRNFPLQKWVNLTVSLYGRTLDIYIDGKLVRTCILPGVAKSGTGGSILVTPGNGFSGWTSQTRYWPDATNPQEAYGIYKDGYGGSIIGNLFNKYRVRISFLEDNQTKGSFEL